MAERRRSGTATVLFTDLAGSTELMARLGDAAFDELRSEHFSRLRRAVEVNGGVEVKNTGDGILATFVSAVDALAAAVASQQATDHHAYSAGAPLAIRVGIGLGEVAFEEGDVFGTPVVEAARLVAVARPGQILCTALVRAVAGSRAGVEFTDLGPLELKGLPDPVPACEVAWEPAAAALPLPSLLAGTGRVFVGRDDELERLHQLWKEAAAGERRLGLLGGEPGIGKTRLATALAAGLYAEGAMVLAGRCDEDLGVPYQPLVEALRHYVTHVREPRLGRHGGELTRLVPELAQLVPDLPEPLRSDPETERYRLFDAVAAWLGDVSTGTPVVLVLDDLHWAAKPTLLLLRHILRTTEALRLLVVATYRDSDLGRGHPLIEFLADACRIEGTERFSLSGLDVSGVAAYLEEAAGHELDEQGEELARVVWRETEGNPFFVAELLRHLSESGALEQRDGRWTVTAAVDELGIPEGVRDVVGRRLSRLSDDANRVLACASVVGLEFEPVVVVQASGSFSEDDVLSALEEAVAARLVIEVPGLVPRNRFSHALVRATLYEELTAARRVALHRKVAEAIEVVHVNRLDDHLPALAHHWARASAPSAETTRAVEYATRAGDRSLAQLAHDEAVTYYRQALELLEIAAAPADDGRRLELLISLGDAQRRAGDPTHRATLLEAAHLAWERSDGDGLARAALAKGRGNVPAAFGVVDVEQVNLLEKALEILTPEDSPMRARLLAALAVELFHSDEPARRATLSDEALAMARRLDDDRSLAGVLLPRFYALASPTTLEARLADTAELVTVVERLADPVATSRALWLRARVLLVAGNIEEADRCLEAQDRLTAELGQPALRWMTKVQQVGRLLLAGRLDEAETLAVEALALGDAAGQGDAPVYFGVQQFQLRFEQGRCGEAEDALLKAAERAPDMPLLRAILAHFACEVGRLDEARTALQELAVQDFARLPFDTLWLRAMCECAVVCISIGDMERARLSYALLAAYADQFLVVAGGIFSGSVAHYLGLLASALGRLEDAEKYLTQAVHAHSGIGAPIWLARSRLEFAAGVLLTRREPGDVERARECLAQALVTARELGLATVERRAVALLE